MTTQTYCDFSESLTCPRCGFQARRRPTYRVCRPVPDDWQPFALGDAVERALSALGVTKERVEQWTRTAGEPGGCGCAARQRWLNEAGFRAQRALRNRLLVYRKFLTGD